MQISPAKPIRGLLVQPQSSSNCVINFSGVARFMGARYSAAPLGLMTVAALLPQHWEFRLIDENVRPLVDADLEWADLVLTGGTVPQQKSTLTIIKRAHNQSKPVVVGGPDPTSQPHVYQNADYLVLGEGEVTIPAFIEDLGKGITSGVYQSELRADMTRAVVPRFDLIRFADYLRVGIQFSRGCPFNCEFCDITQLFGRRPRTKTPDHILAELQTLYDLGYRGHVDFVDDNFIGNKTRVTEVLGAMSEWSKRHNYPFYFSTEATVNLASEEKLLRLMGENDFRYVFVGIESPDEDVLIEAQKAQNRYVSIVEAVRTLTSHGMIVNGGFILGFDNETEHTAGNMIDLIQKTGICMAIVGMLTALPNTQLSRRLDREGRLFFGGALVMVDSSADIDNTTSGLNFTTARPRTAILRDLVEVSRQIYDPEKYYARVLLTATNLAPNYKHRPNFSRALKLALAFLRVSARVGLNRNTGILYWKTLFKVLVKNPKAANMVVTMAALHTHFSKHAEFVTRLYEQNIEHIRSVGEEDYVQKLIATDYLVGAKTTQAQSQLNESQLARLRPSANPRT